MDCILHSHRHVDVVGPYANRPIFTKYLKFSINNLSTLINDDNTNNEFLFIVSFFRIIINSIIPEFKIQIIVLENRNTLITYYNSSIK